MNEKKIVDDAIRLVMADSLSYPYGGIINVDFTSLFSTLMKNDKYRRELVKLVLEVSPENRIEVLSKFLQTLKTTINNWIIELLTGKEKMENIWRRATGAFIVHDGIDFEDEEIY